MGLELRSVKSVSLSGVVANMLENLVLASVHSLSVQRDNLHFFISSPWRHFHLSSLVSFPVFIFPSFSAQFFSLSSVSSSQCFGVISPPPETIPGLFCKCSGKHQFCMACTQSAVTTGPFPCPTQATLRDPVNPEEHKYSLAHEKTHISCHKIRAKMKCITSKKLWWLPDDLLITNQF